MSADRLTRHAVYGEICQMIAELEMVSQARAYGVLDIAAASDRAEDVGGGCRVWAALRKSHRKP